ncbi:MAG: type II toxin-antitoxin system RelE/ParE family toxin [Candidatus Omnitrophica bacterium]|nr:type II toxin-antitoxin system RelE/ParE family toxin [Candidatus Omnitrophota bacterium]
MGPYKLCWKESVRKDLRRLPSATVSKIVKRVESLPENPVPIDCKKLRDTEHTYRLRAGDYRIIYQLNTSDKEIIVSRVRHRKDAYRI